MPINDFEGSWTIRAANSDILDVGGILEVSPTSETAAEIRVQNPGKSQETLGDAQMDESRLILSPFQYQGGSYHFEAVRADNPRGAERILYGILYLLAGPPGGDDGATGVWGADEEAPDPRRR